MAVEGLSTGNYYSRLRAPITQAKKRIGQPEDSVGRYRDDRDQHLSPDHADRAGVAEHEVADQVVYVESCRWRHGRVGPARFRHGKTVGFGSRLLLVFDHAHRACAVKVLRKIACS